VTIPAEAILKELAMQRRFACLLLGVIFGSGAVAAQTAASPPAVPTATPLKGQTAEQSALDQSECKNSATQATGYIPNATATPAPATSSGPSGARVAGAARGAAAGAVVGGVQNNQHPNAPSGMKDEHVENQAATGAAVGVMAGGSRARQSRRQEAAAQQTAQQQQAASATSWQNSYNACLQQRGYSIP
jgi:hypothetical protein